MHGRIDMCQLYYGLHPVVEFRLLRASCVIVNWPVPILITLRLYWNDLHLSCLYFVLASWPNLVAVTFVARQQTTG